MGGSASGLSGKSGCKWSSLPPWPQNLFSSPPSSECFPLHLLHKKTRKAKEKKEKALKRQAIPLVRSKKSRSFRFSPNFPRRSCRRLQKRNTVANYSNTEKKRPIYALVPRALSARKRPDYSRILCPPFVLPRFFCGYKLLEIILRYREGVLELS